MIMTALYFAVSKNLHAPITEILCTASQENFNLSHAQQELQFNKKNHPVVPKHNTNVFTT